MSSLTGEQQRIFDVITQTQGPGLHLFTLDSRAGSGKSFLAATLMKYFADQGKQTHYHCPYNSMVDSFKSVLKEISSKPKKDDDELAEMLGEFESPEKRFRECMTIYRGLRVRNFLGAGNYELKGLRSFSSDFLLIVDEAGLINIQLSLRIIEYFNYLSTRRIQHGVVLLMGDSSQLEPIGFQGRYPPLFAHYRRSLSKFQHFELTEILRVDPRFPNFRRTLNQLYQSIRDALAAKTPITSIDVSIRFSQLLDDLKECKNVTLFKQLDLTESQLQEIIQTESGNLGFVAFRNVVTSRYRRMTTDFFPLRANDPVFFKLGVSIPREFKGNKSIWRISPAIPWLVSSRQSFDSSSDDEEAEMDEKFPTPDQFVKVRVTLNDGDEIAYLPRDEITYRQLMDHYKTFRRQAEKCKQCKWSRDQIETNWMKRYEFCRDHFRCMTTYRRRSVRDGRFTTLHATQGRSMQSAIVHIRDIHDIIRWYYFPNPEKKSEAEPKLKKRKKMTLSNEDGKFFMHDTWYHSEIHRLYQKYKFEEIMDLPEHKTTTYALRLYRALYVALSRSRHNLYLIV